MFHSYKEVFRKIENELEGALRRLTEKLSKSTSALEIDQTVGALRNTLRLHGQFVVTQDDSPVVMVHKETLKKAGWKPRQSWPGDEPRGIVWLPPESKE